MSHFFTGMSSFVFINIVVVIVLLLYFFGGKSSPKPSKLNLSAKKNLDSSSHKNPENMRSLTIYFQYNGETKEAYSTLGLPAGASLEMAEAAYQKIIAENTQVDNLCLDAIEAIRKVSQAA